MKEGCRLKEYYCDITTVSDEDFRVWYTRMSSDRQKKCDRIQIKEAKKLCIAADNLTRTAVSEALCLPAEQIEIRISPSGKPYIEGNPVYFSYSHSGTLVACAVSAVPVGIDIEQIRPVLPGVRERICTPGEWEFLNGAETESERNSRFFYLWTRKEAVFKVDGRLPRKDRETDVLNLPEGWTVKTRTEGEYTISVAKRQKL